jgi:hypothetical protein
VALVIAWRCVLHGTIGHNDTKSARELKYILHLISKSSSVYMPNNDTEEENFFRERYSQELQKKKNQQQGSGSYLQGDEMAEERRKVNQQEGKTPGRRGEQIKQEEIDKEIVRREMLKQKNKNN